MDQLAKILTPTEVSPSIVNISFENIVKYLIKKSIRNNKSSISEDNINNIYEKYKNILEKLKNQNREELESAVKDFLKVLGDISGEEISDITISLNIGEVKLDPETLKGIYNSIKNYEKIMKKYNILFLFDTCYNKNKYEELKNAIGEICKKYGSSKNCNEIRKILIKITLIVAALFAYASKASINEYDKVSWFLDLLKIASSGSDRYFPACPTEGDAIAALLIAAENTDDINNLNVDVEPNDIIEMIKKLLNIP